MKKFFLSAVLVCALISVGVAQPRAIGVRLGYDAEFSYQHAFATRNMIDLSVGYTGFFKTGDTHYQYVDVNCMFDWVFNITGGLNWYIGPGVGVGYYFGDDYYGNHPYRLNVGGQIGLEYQFSIPLNLSIDWRPMTNVLSGYDGYTGDWYGVCLGIRYRFH